MRYGHFEVPSVTVRPNASLSTAAQALRQHGVYLGETVALCVAHPNWQNNYLEAVAPQATLLGSAEDITGGFVNPATCQEWVRQAGSRALQHLFDGSLN